MRYKLLIYLLMIILSPGVNAMAGEKGAEGPVSTKKERNHITKGNGYYNDGRYKEAMVQYQAALKENPSSVVGRYNLGLSELRIGSNSNDTTETAKKMLESGVQNMQQIANMGKTRPELASKANYNLGNVSFNSQDYGQAISYYKQALRLNPNDNNARRNLRIAQLRQQNQNQDQNEDQEEDSEENQEQDQNKDQEQNQDENQDQNQDQQNQDQNQEQQQNQSQSIDRQTAEQILNAMENKENQTRARVAGKNAEKSRARNRNRLNW